jgi:hypothetical protein
MEGDVPKLWLPPKPAIIRPAKPVIGMLLPVPLAAPALLGSGPKNVTTLTFVTSATDVSGAAFTLPTDIIAGDLIVVWDTATNAPAAGGPVPTAATPAGFTNDIDVDNGLDARAMFSHKIANGTEGGTSVNGMNAVDGEGKITAVFRGDAPLATASILSPAEQITDINPTAQVVTSGSGTPPLIVFGLYGNGFVATVDPRTFSPAKDNEISASILGLEDIWLAYKIYNLGDTPANVSIDMDDEGAVNELASCYIQCT